MSRPYRFHVILSPSTLTSDHRCWSSFVFCSVAYVYSAVFSGKDHFFSLFLSITEPLENHPGHPWLIDQLYLSLSTARRIFFPPFHLKNGKLTNSLLIYRWKKISNNHQYLTAFASRRRQKRIIVFVFKRL